MRVLARIDLPLDALPTVRRRRRHHVRDADAADRQQPVEEVVHEDHAAVGGRAARAVDRAAAEGVGRRDAVRRLDEVGPLVEQRRVRGRVGAGVEEEDRALVLFDHGAERRPRVERDTLVVTGALEGVFSQAAVRERAGDVGGRRAVRVDEQQRDELAGVLVQEAAHAAEEVLQGAGVLEVAAGVAHLQAAVVLVDLSLQEAHAAAELVADRAVLVLRGQRADEGRVVRAHLRDVGVGAGAVRRVAVAAGGRGGRGGGRGEGVQEGREAQEGEEVGDAGPVGAPEQRVPGREPHGRMREEVGGSSVGRREWICGSGVDAMESRRVGETRVTTLQRCRNEGGRVRE